MAYIEQTWVGGKTGTPVSVSRLQHMEDGIAAAAVVADIGTPGTATGDALGASFARKGGALDARDYITSGSTIDFAALVVDMAAQRKAAYIPGGSWTAAAASVLLNSASPSFAYHFRGDGVTTTSLTLPAGMASGTFLFGANVDASGNAIGSSLYAHPDVSFTNMLINGGSSPNGTFLRAHQRSLALDRVAFRGLLFGVKTSGYCDMVRLSQVYADNMTAGGWVYQQTGFGDGLTVDGFMSYASAGISLTKMNGGRLSGLVSGWHEFIESDVQISGLHLEGDGTTSTAPLISCKGSRLHLASGVLYTGSLRAAVEIDDNNGTSRRHSSVTLGHELYFQQRLDDPGSTVGDLQGVAVNIKQPAKETDLRLENVRARLFKQNATTSDVSFEYVAPVVSTPNSTADEISLLTVLNARKPLLGGQVEIRYRNAAWEVDAPDLFGAMRTTRRSTSPAFVSAAAANPMTASWTTLAAGTYFYRIWTRDPENRQTAVSAEVSATTTSGNPVPMLTINAYIAPCTLFIQRGTTSGTYTAFATVVVTKETPVFYDQGDAIAGQPWATTGIPAAPTINATYDGFVTRGTGGRVVIYGGTPPTDGTWNQGDVMWNTSANAAGSPGWVCVTGGTPGTWKAMANVAA